MKRQWLVLLPLLVGVLVVAVAEPPRAVAEPPRAVAEPPRAVAEPPRAVAEPPRAVARKYPRKTVRRLAPGITHVRIVRRYPPNQVNVLRVSVRARPSIDVALASPSSFGFARTSLVAARHRAIAAVNGTFSLDTGRPYSVFARNGELKASPLLWSRAFSLSTDEGRLFMGHPRLTIEVRDPTEEDSWELSTFNGLARGDEMVLNAPVGLPDYPPPRNACSARLRRASILRWDGVAVGVERSYRVEELACSSSPMVANKLLLSARRGTDLASDLKDLDEENLLTVGWTVGWPRAVDIMGGNPLLLTERRVVAPNWCASYFCHRNPRTGIGITGRGKVLLVTVDGRQPRRSVGMTLAGFARVFKNLGATDAINLDGGGSTTMVIRGRVVNRPSDHQGERRVGSVILVRGYTPPPLRTTPTSHVASGTQTREAPDSLELDPGSTGGMLDAFARGALGPRHPAIPRTVQPLLRAYRSPSSTR